jgi:hypothetical protein
VNTLPEHWPPLLELRQYALRPDRRDDLIQLFDAKFVESQEKLGMGIYGQFRDLDDADRFVWLRGYPTADPAARAQALAAFYGGPVWRANSRAANATMIDSDDVFLLAPLRDREPFTGADGRPPVGSAARSSVVEVTMCRLQRPPDQALLDVVAGDALALVSELAGTAAAGFRSSDVPNTFPALPVRGDPIVAWLVRFDDAAAHGAYRQRLADEPRWTEGVWPRIHARLRDEPSRLRLAPTGRSRLR